MDSDTDTHILEKLIISIRKLHMVISHLLLTYVSVSIFLGWVFPSVVHCPLTLHCCPALSQKKKGGFGHRVQSRFKCIVLYVATTMLVMAALIIWCSRQSSIQNKREEGIAKYHLQSSFHLWKFLDSEESGGWLN